MISITVKDTIKLYMFWLKL